MEEYVRIDSEDVLWTFCDGCNDTQDPVCDGVWKGPAYDAMEHGWSEVDFGHLCLSCSIAEAQMEEMGNTSVTLEQALATLDPENPLLKLGVKDWTSEAEKVEDFHKMAKEDMYEKVISEKGQKALVEAMRNSPEYDWPAYWERFEVYLGRKLPPLPVLTPDPVPD